ncbi:MAG: PorP/SprF family type IX secretion system membrane protein [Bacteroidota bacterium]|jgi:type IX secretion system PorP/SprF family membrane protein
MTRKGYLILIFFSAFVWHGLVSDAQQIAQYSQYQLNYYALNPAAAGSYGCTDFRLGYRTQWVGFEGAPKTTILSMNLLLKHKKKVWRKTRHGIGFLLENDLTGVAGPIRQTGLFLSYAYHVPIAGNTYLSAGLFAGIVQYSLQTDKFNAVNNGINDPALASSGQALIFPDLNPGVLLYSPDHFIGLSLKKALGNSLSDATKSPNANYGRHILLTAGKTFSKESLVVTFTPSIHLMWAAYGMPSVTGTFAATYEKQFELGIFYRSISDCVGSYIRWTNDVINIGYSFDYTLSKVRMVSANTHEIVFSYKFCQKDVLPSQTDCPAFK